MDLVLMMSPLSRSNTGRIDTNLDTLRILPGRKDLDGVAFIGGVSRLPRRSENAFTCGWRPFVEFRILRSIRSIRFWVVRRRVLSVRRFANRAAALRENSMHRASRCEIEDTLLKAKNGMGGNLRRMRIERDARFHSERELKRGAFM